MKRLLPMLVVAATAALSIFVGAASAAGTLSVEFSPSASPGDTVTFTGTLADSPPGYNHVWVNVFGDSECSLGSFTDIAGGPFVVDPETGSYTIPITLPTTMELGTVYVQATTFEFDTTSGCEPLQIVSAPAASAAPAPRQANNIFLCYSAYQDQPGVWPESQAKALLAQGYWYPYAVSGKVAGGTTIGDYHLTCNIAATQSVSHSFMGGDGTILGAAYAGVFGVYPVVGK